MDNRQLALDFTAFVGVFTTMVRSYTDIHIRRDRYKLIREVLERGDTTNLLIVALATSEQGRKLQENHDSKQGYSSCLSIPLPLLCYDARTNRTALAKS